MLTNKKTSIRLLALVMALLMTAAAFVGCGTSKAAQAEIDAAKAAAAAAQAAADAAAAQIAAIEKQLAEAQKEAQSAKDAADAAQKEIDSIHDGETKAPDAIEKDPYDEATNFVTESILADFSALKVQYLNIQQNWYTDENYVKLAKLFDDASTALYRATSKDGVVNVLAKLSADAAAIANIYTDAEAVQALIVALGNIDTEVTLADAGKVTAAENAYLGWVEDYVKYFGALGITAADYEKDADVAKKVDKIAVDEFGISVLTIDYAQNKIVLLTYLGETVSAAAFKAVMNNMDKDNDSKTPDTIEDPSDWGKTRYEDLKRISEIVEAFELYKTFVVLNGGDESPITHSQIINNGTSNQSYTLKGEDFVKQYVNIIYVAWFQQYQTAVKTFLNYMPEFFMQDELVSAPETLTGDYQGTTYNRLVVDLKDLDKNYLGAYDNAIFGANTEIEDFKGAEFDGQKAGLGTWNSKISIYDSLGDTEKFRNELEAIATIYNADVLKYDYLNDFKGKMSLEDAFRELDVLAEKAVLDMAQAYYTQVLVAYEANKLETAVKVRLATATVFANADVKAAAADATAAFTADIEKLVADAKAYMSEVKIDTYDKLNSRWESNKALYNIDNLDLFVINDYVNAGYISLELNVAAAESKSPIKLILNGVEEANATMYKALGDKYYNQIAKEIQFFEFKKDLANQLLTVEADLTDTDALDDVNAIYKNVGKTALTADSSAWKSYKSAQDALLAESVKAIMAIDYDDYKATTAVATKKGSTTVYENSASLTTTKKNALNIVIDKIVVAKDAAVAEFAKAADKYFTNYLDLFRADVNAQFEAAYATYQKNYGSYTESANLMTDITAYVDHLKALTTATSVTSFTTAAFRHGTALTATSGKIADYVTANPTLFYDASGKVLHVTGYAAAADIAADYCTKMNDDIDELALLVTKVEVEDGANNAKREVAYVYVKLAEVRRLAFFKDDALAEVDVILAAMKGEWDAEKNTWKTAPVLDYAINSSRKAVYLAELEKTAENLRKTIKGMSLLHADVKGKTNDYVLATGFIEGYVGDVNGKYDAAGNGYATQPTQYSGTYAKAYIHDLSFYTTYDRYYETNEYDFAADNYDWEWYNKQ